MLLSLLVAATIQGPFDIESLTASADAVVHGRVIRQTSAWTKAGGQIFTTVVLHVSEIWKGTPAREMTVLVPGGEVGDLSQTVQGAATFHDGEEVVVFLHRRAARTYAVQGMALGKFAVEAPADLPKRAVRDRRGVTCLRCGPAEGDDLALDELRARVLGSAPR
jgi:hypothetical protein